MFSPACTTDHTEDAVCIGCADRIPSIVACAKPITESIDPKATQDELEDVKIVRNHLRSRAAHLSDLVKELYREKAAIAEQRDRAIMDMDEWRRLFNQLQPFVCKDVSAHMELGKPFSWGFLLPFSLGFLAGYLFGLLV